jgi:hypothetical protein
MQKDNILNLIKSTSIVLFISALGGLGAYLIHLDFFAAFILLFVFQYIIFSFVGSLITNYFTQKTKQKELDSLEPLSTILECAYCKSNNLMTFFPNQDERIEFECVSCKKTNLVNINFSVARVTDTINVPNLTGIPLIDDKE